MHTHPNTGPSGPTALFRSDETITDDLLRHFARDNPQRAQGHICPQDHAILCMAINDIASELLTRRRAMRAHPAAVTPPATITPPPAPTIDGTAETLSNTLDELRKLRTLTAGIAAMLGGPRPIKGAN